MKNLQKTLSMLVIFICMFLFSCESKQKETESGDITTQDLHRALICAARTQGADLAKGIIQKNFAILLASKKISLSKDTALARFYLSSMNEIGEKVEAQNRSEK